MKLKVKLHEHLEQYTQTFPTQAGSADAATEIRRLSSSNWCDLLAPVVEVGWQATLKSQVMMRCQSMPDANIVLLWQSG